MDELNKSLDTLMNLKTDTSYRFKTAEEAELLPLELQILRLKDINQQLVTTHNTLVIENAKLYNELKELKCQLSKTT